MYDVIIIGAGVVGGMVARELSRFNVSVLILEKENDVARGATGANSGIVHAGFDAATGSLKAHLNVLGCKMMKDVAAELGVKYVNNGSLVIAFGPEQDEHVKVLYARGIANGVEGLKILDSKELHELEPNVAPDATSALFAPSAGIICPYSLAIAAVGSQDIGDCSQLIPRDPGVEVIAGSSDHTVLDVTESEREWKPGDTVSFSMFYMPLLQCFSTSHVAMRF